MTDIAQIITSYSRRYIVRTSDGRTYETSTRKKQVDSACGDRVHIQTVNAEQAVIEDYLPRGSLLYRQDVWKTKLITTNVSQFLTVTAAVPSSSEALLQRALLAAEATGIQVVTVLNRADLPETALRHEKLRFYKTLGYPVIKTCASKNVDILRPVLQGHTNILLGQSGMGKSTLTNALLGSQTTHTDGISIALDSGKYTTTHTQLYDLNEEAQLIDSPGLQKFGLHHLQVADLLQYFPDLNRLVRQCRLHNCIHHAEPGYVVRAAADSRRVLAKRIAFL